MTDGIAGGPVLFGLTVRLRRFARVLAAPPRESRSLLRGVTALVCLCTLFPDIAQAQRPAGLAQVPQATVPDVRNRPLETALAMIDKAGLARGRIVDRPSPGRPGIVLDQSLEPGRRVERGTPLHLGVAQRQQEQPAIVPDVRNRPLETALAMIDKAGLSRGRIADRPSPGRPGIVLDQSLEPGRRVERGTPLHLGVAQQQQQERPVIVPDVVNRPLETALAMIEKAGLSRGRIADRPSPGRPGIVLDQSLEPGRRVERGTPLHLGVAQEQLATVPSVVNLPIGEALARIDTAQLARGTVSSRESPGTPDLVIEQSLRPGAQVRRGTPLNVTVSQEQLATVPNVIDLPLGEAQAQIDKAQLARGAVSNRESPGTPDLVLDQSLRPGARVRRGTPLNLTVSQVQLVTVPDLTRLPVAAALERIESAGLSRGNVTNRPTPGAADLVLEQSVNPGARVPRGTALHLTVSRVRLVTVPDLTTLPAGDALARIENSGLTRGRVANRPSTGPPDVVLDQSPTPGTQVPRGTPLNVTLSQAQPAIPPDVTPPPVDRPLPSPVPSPLFVPDLVGQSVAEARARAGQAGLAVGTVTERSFLLPPYFQSAGTVYQQQPAAGTPLATPVPVELIVLPRTPVWAIIIPSVLLGASLGLLLRRRPSSPLRAPPSPQVPLPAVATRVYTDAGDQRIPSAMTPTSPEIRVRHYADPGSQSIREALTSPPSR